MLAFSMAGRHLNLVRAAQEMHITQGALSRQIKALENHLGVRLFERRARGLAFTQEGELLYDYACRAFETLDEGVARLTLRPARHTLVLSVARSFAQRVLVPRLSGFAQACPQVDLRLDIHRYFADLASCGADISIRLGKGEWDEYRTIRLTADRIVPVCAPPISARLRDPLRREDVPRLRNVEHDWEPELARAGAGLWPMGSSRMDFNDSATLLQAAEAGLGLAAARTSLAAAALSAGRLVRPFDCDLRDGLDYYAVCTERAAGKPAVKLFTDWLEQEFPLPRP